MSAPTLEDLIFQADQALAPEDERDPADLVEVEGETWRAIVAAARARDQVVVTPEGERVARPLTPDQHGALLNLIATSPRWKHVLRKIWAEPHLFTGYRATDLYSLRNTHGPAWLEAARAKDFK